MYYAVYTWTISQLSKCYPDITSDEDLYYVLKSVIDRDMTGVANYGEYVAEFNDIDMARAFIKNVLFYGKASKGVSAPDYAAILDIDEHHWIELWT